MLWGNSGGAGQGKGAPSITKVRTAKQKALPGITGGSAKVLWVWSHRVWTWLDPRPAAPFFRKLPDVVRTYAVVAEVPRLPTMNCHGEDVGKLRQNTTNVVTRAH